MTKTPPTDETLKRLASVVGPNGVIWPGADQKPYLEEWRGKWHGRTPLVLRPANTEEVSRLLAIAFETRTAIVPQSGNTGLVGGQIPDPAGHEVLLSLDRMTAIREVDAQDFTLTAEAGITLKSIQDAAAANDRYFPLSLASEGSCRIGGNLASNAGGLNVLAYGNARDLCLGLEVVLSDGRIWNGLRKLRKDNTGYDLRDIFIGSEGTLGIITAAVLKLFPQIGRKDTAFAAIRDPAAGLDLLAHAQKLSGNSVIAFELVPDIGIRFAELHMGARRSLAQPSPWCVLLELADTSEGTLDTILEQALEKGWINDAAVAQSETQRQDFWDVREKLSEAQKFEGGSIKHDVAVPLSRLPQFIAEGLDAVARFMPGCRPVCFGHMGDGNMHFNISQPVGMDKATFLAQWKNMNEVVHAIVLKHGGTISAEHGIGILKRDEMAKIKSPVELELMRGLKQLFDPKGILSPGRVLPQ
jgi:FAD/FMN-containing dehydrogenase